MVPVNKKDNEFYKQVFEFSMKNFLELPVNLKTQV